MSASTIREYSNYTRETDFPFACSTIISHAGRNSCAATIPERSSRPRYPNINTAALTLRWEGEPDRGCEGEVDLSARYRILRKLCPDGVEAELFLCERLYDRETVVLKVYHPGIAPEPMVMERLRALSQPVDAGIVSLYEHGWSGERYYEVQEYFPGSTLDALFCGHPLPASDAELILKSVSDGLHLLHSADPDGMRLVHRDIKPANLVISDQSTLDLAICDFGISALTGGTTKERFRCDCTPLYASPETFSGTITPKADYWSLGIILLEALTGSHPLSGNHPSHIEALHRQGWQPAVSDTLSPHWQTLLRGLTEIRPEDRWGYAEIRTWLDPQAGETAEAHEETEAAADFDDFIESFAYLEAATLVNFAINLIENWIRVAPLVDDDIFIRYLKRTLARLAPDRDFGELLDKSGHPDIRLLRLIYRLLPSFPSFWKARSVELVNLADICGGIVHGEQGDGWLIEELYDLKVLEDLAVLKGNSEIAMRATGWSNAVEEYCRLKGLMLQAGAPPDIFPQRRLALAKLYLMSAAGDEEFHDRLSPELLFFFPWLQPLQHEGDTSPAALKFIRDISLQACHGRLEGNFTVTHPDITSAVTVEARQVRTSGWRWPTAALTAMHIELEMDIFGRKSVVARGVHLRWNVEGAICCYLTGFGFVSATGQRPDARMAQRTVYSVLDSCGCEHHDSVWFTISETTTFTLTAIGPTGFSIYRLPPIVVPVPELLPQAELSVPIPELMPQQELSVPVPELLPPEQLAVPQEQLQPSIVFSVTAMTVADLPPFSKLTIPQLGRRDLSPAAKFSTKSDHQLRIAREKGLLRKRRVTRWLRKITR